MSGHFFFLRGSLLLFALGCFCIKQEEQWTFTFPKSLNAIKHSDVEIPCNFTAPAEHGEVRIVWYVHRLVGYPIVYSEDSSIVTSEYRRRTSLINNGTNSCSLRIKDVTKTEWYFPGISKDINSFTLYKEDTQRAVLVKVPGCSENLSCKDWEFIFPRSIDVLRDSCVEIPCKLKYPENAQNFTLFWYKYNLIGYPKIFNSRSSTDVEEKYKGRTFLVGNLIDSCSLRINDVQEPLEIYPGINTDINSYDLQNGRYCRVFVIESPSAPLIKENEQMIENEQIHISCSVNHTCASSPPSITWNRPDLEATMSHEDLDRGTWRKNSTIKYVPSYKDDKTQLECTVTFQNKKTSSQSVTLDIKYKPKNVTISVVHNIQKKEGDNVTLQCTSHANPPETQYTWYKDGKTKTVTGAGIQITVQNVTSEKYICSARNDIGTGNSPVFSLMAEDAAESWKPQNMLIIGGAAGCAAVAIIVLVIIICIVKRRKQTSAHLAEKETQKNVQIKEQISMDNLLYENFGGAEQNSPTTRNFLHGQNDGSGEESSSCRYKEKESEKSIVYTSVELSANHIPKTLGNTEETEYAQLDF